MRLWRSLFQHTVVDQDGFLRLAALNITARQISPDIVFHPVMIEFLLNERRRVESLVKSLLRARVFHFSHQGDALAAIAGLKLRSLLDRGAVQCNRVLIVPFRHTCPLRLVLELGIPSQIILIGVESQKNIFLCDFQRQEKTVDRGKTGRKPAGKKHDDAPELSAERASPVQTPGPRPPSGVEKGPGGERKRTGSRIRCGKKVSREPSSGSR